MKLLTRTNIYFLILTLIVFSLGSEVFYQRVHAINKLDADERLQDEKQRVIDYVNTNQALPHNTILLGDSVAFVTITAGEPDKIGHVKSVSYTHLRAHETGRN